MKTYTIDQYPSGEQYIHCHRCDRKSFNKNDIKNLYCGKCGAHCPKNVEKLDDDHAKFYTDMGYGLPIKLNGEIVALGKFIFTTGIMVGMDETGYKHRYCYHTQIEAEIGLLSWIGSGDVEPSGYITKK